jgi:hypothetical protein
MYHETLKQETGNKKRNPFKLAESQKIWQLSKRTVKREGGSTRIVS